MWENIKLLNKLRKQQSRHVQEVNLELLCLWKTFLILEKLKTHYGKLHVQNTPKLLSLKKIFKYLEETDDTPEKITCYPNFVHFVAFFSECFYQKKLLYAFCNMVMEYKNIVGQAPTLFLNPGA